MLYSKVESSPVSNPNILRKKWKLLAVVGVSLCATILVLSVYHGAVASEQERNNAGPAHEETSSDPEYGVWGYYPWDDIPLQEGWNVRDFNETNAEPEDSLLITLDDTGTTLNLGHGLYFVTGFSLVRYRDLDSDETQYPEENPLGHCRLSDNQGTVQGSLGSTMWATPSLFHAIMDVQTMRHVTLEHEVSPYIPDLWFGMDRTGSHHHVFARMSAIQLDPSLQYIVFAYHAYENLEWADSDQFIPFNTIESHSPSSASSSDGDILDTDTGHFTLQAGTYHVRGNVLISNMDTSDPTTWEEGEHAAYCYFREATGEDPARLAKGSMMSSTYSTNCLIDTIFTLDDATEMALSLAFGDDVNFYLGMGSAEAPEVFARLAITEAGDLPYVVLSYFPEEDTPAEEGWNRRIFTVADAEQGSAINYTLSTGEVTLGVEGTYRVSGFSLIVSPTFDEPPLTGYCEIKSTAGEVLTTGSLAVAAYKQHSHFDHVVTVQRNSPITFYVQHQVGQNVNDTFVGLDATGSHAHLFARMTVTQLA